MDRPEPIRIVKRVDWRLPGRRQIATQSGRTRSARAQDVRIDDPTQPAAAHLLVAEDDPDMRRFLVQSFEEEGYRVTAAQDGDELRRRLAEEGHAEGTSAPDILVSDIRLPGCSGLDLLAELRRSDWSLPVILITGFGDEEVHYEGERLGAAMVFDKPFDIDDLVNAVKTLVPAN